MEVSEIKKIKIDSQLDSSYKTLSKGLVKSIENI